MGERTFFSLPKHPLPNRRNIVLSDREDFTFENTEVVHSIAEAQAAVAEDEQAFIIGGGMVYRQFLPLVDKLYITHIHHSWEDADTFFPDFDKSNYSRQVIKKGKENDLAFSIVKYTAN